MFDVGTVVQFRITGAKVMVLKADKIPGIGDGKNGIIYTVRLPDYKRGCDIQDFELEEVAK